MGTFDCLQLSMRSDRREVSDARDMKKRRLGERRATKVNRAVASEVNDGSISKQGPGK